MQPLLQTIHLRRSAPGRVREPLWRRWALAALLAVCGIRVPDAGAQRIEHAPQLTGPTLVGERAAFPSLAPEPVRDGAVSNRAAVLRLRNRTKLMLFGTAIFLTGALIGDDAGTVIMIGGAGIALTGLYLTLWPPDERLAVGGQAGSEAKLSRRLGSGP